MENVRYGLVGLALTTTMVALLWVPFGALTYLNWQHLSKRLSSGSDMSTLRQSRNKTSYTKTVHIYCSVCGLWQKRLNVIDVHHDSKPACVDQKTPPHNGT